MQNVYNAFVRTLAVRYPLGNVITCGRHVSKTDLRGMGYDVEGLNCTRKNTGVTFCKNGEGTLGFITASNRLTSTEDPLLSV